MRNTWKNTLFGGGLLSLLVLLISVSVEANGHSRADEIKSTGVVTYEDALSNYSATIDSSDLRLLANEIDVLEDDVKEGIKDSLSVVGTDASGDTTFNQLFLHIKSSQDIKSENVAAVSRNLSLGTAAWVQGTYVVGNGGDVDAAYQRGYADGLANRVNGEIQYIYHTHTGDKTLGTGCYIKPVYHVHVGNKNSYGGCYTRLTGHTHTSSCVYYATDGWGGHTDGSPNEGAHRHAHGGTGTYDNKCSCVDCIGADGVPGMCCNGKYHVKITAGWSCDNKPLNTYSPGCNLTNVRVGWDIGCEKQEGVTIDSAIIVFP